MSRCSIFAALSLAALACSPAADPAVRPPRVAPPRPAVVAPAWQEVRAAALGLTFSVPSEAVVKGETRSSTAENEAISLELEWPDGARLSVDRSSREDRAIAFPAKTYVEELRKAAGQISRDEEVDVAGRVTLAIDGVKGGTRTWTRVLAVGRSVYTLALSQPSQGDQAVAERVFGSVKLAPTSRIFVWKEGRCMVAIPDVAAVEPVKVSKPEGAQTLSVKIAADDGGDGWLITRFPPNPAMASLTPSQRLELTVRGFASQGQIDKLKPIEIDGVVGRDVEIHEAHGVFMRIRAFAAGDTIQAVLVSSPDRAALSAPNALAFVESFRSLP